MQRLLRLSDTVRPVHVHITARAAASRVTRASLGDARLRAWAPDASHAATHFGHGRSNGPNFTNALEELPTAGLLC